MSGGHLRAVLTLAAVPYKDYPGVASIDIDAGRLCISLDFHRGDDERDLAYRLCKQLDDGYAVILREIQAREGSCFKAERLSPHLRRAWKFAGLLSQAAARIMPQPRGEDDE